LDCTCATVAYRKWCFEPFCLQTSILCTTSVLLENTTETFVQDDLAVANEFGHKTNYTADFLSEYGQRVMENSALELTRYYFKD
jgi:hypothetical protein